MRQKTLSSFMVFYGAKINKIFRFMVICYFFLFVGNHFVFNFASSNINLYHNVANT